jgi:hypothetical protein
LQASIISCGLNPQICGEKDSLFGTHTTVFVVSTPFVAFQPCVLTGLLQIIILKMEIQQIMKGNFNSFM